MTRAPAKVRGYPTSPDGAGEKPYRVYRGGRVKGKVPRRRSGARQGATRRPDARHDHAGGGPRAEASRAAPAARRGSA